MGVESHLPEKWECLPTQASVRRGREEESRLSREEGQCGLSLGLEEDFEMSHGNGVKESVDRSSGRRAGATDWCGRGEARSEGVPDVASAHLALSLWI